MTERHRGFEVGDEKAPNRILWIHGYTGSPDAFTTIAEALAQRLHARVSVPLLPGHGTEEHHLIGHTFDDFLSSARHFASQLEHEGQSFAIIGYSFGSLIALLLAAEYKPRALALALVPYQLRFPFWVPGVASFFAERPFWHKFLNAQDIEDRRGTFYYPDFPGATIRFTVDSEKRIAEVLPRIDCPILTINTADDPLIKPESGKRLLDASGHNEGNEYHVLAHGRHALFFPPHHEEEQELLIKYLEKYLK